MLRSKDVEQAQLYLNICEALWENDRDHRYINNAVQYICSTVSAVQSHVSDHAKVKLPRVKWHSIEHTQIN